MIFDPENDAWYKDITNENKIRQYIEEEDLNRAYDFLHCFLLGSGLDSNAEFREIVEEYREDRTETIKIDLTEFLKRNFGQLNKPLRTIFKFSEKFYIEDSNEKVRVLFVWEDIDLEEDFEGLPDKTYIQPLRNLNEDLVTYITVHNVLRPNGYKILAVSYPGAQGDRVILIEPEKGRRQKRKYLDVISFSSEKDITTLQENKGKFSSDRVQSSINEVVKYHKKS